MTKDAPQLVFLKKNGPIPAFFVYFPALLDTISIIQIEKSVEGVLGIRTQGRKMVGTYETTELWRPPTTVVNDSILPIYVEYYLPS